MAKDDVEVVRTTAWSAGPGCHGGCGVLAYVKDGKLLKIEGDKDHPYNQGRVCPRCLAITQYIYHPERLGYPIKRIGDRGEGKWKRITWETAFNTIEQGLKKIKKEYGPESVVFLQGTGRDVWLTLLAYSYGSPNWMFPLSGLACYCPRIMGMWLAQGEYSDADASQWLPKRYDDPRYEVPKCIVVWGYNLPATCIAGFFGHWIVDLMKRGSRLIVVDPRCTWLASRAEVWLQIRPGTDGALALGLLNVIINEELYDRKFVEKWTNAPFLVREDTGTLLKGNDIVAGGDPSRFVVWDMMTADVSTWNTATLRYASSDVKPALEGTFEVKLFDGETVKCETVWTMLKKRVNEYPPRKVAEITWTQEKKIVEAARFYAKSKPAAIHLGVSVEGSSGATPTSQAIAQLWCITGNLDIPGGNVIKRYPFNVATYPYHKGAGPLKISPDVDKKRIGTWKYGAVRDFRSWAHPDTALDQIFTEEPYPIKGLWIQASNLLACTTQDPRRWYEALKKLDLVVAVDVFMTPTTMLADIVLPAATYLEKDSLKAVGGVPLQVTKKIVEFKEAKSDLEIDFEMAKRLNRDLRWKTCKEMLDDVMKPSGMTYDQLSEKVWAMPPMHYEKYKKGLLRSDGKPGFATPSGKIELYSSWLKLWELDPLPYHEEPPFSPVSRPDLYREYPLILSTGRKTSVYFHSEHRNIPWLREHEPDPIVEIHPKTAKQIGITDGQWVWVENWVGKCKFKAKVTPIVHPSMVMATHGWWFPEKQGSDPSLFGVWESNVNLLIPMGLTGKSGLGSPFKCMLCKVYKVD